MRLADLRIARITPPGAKIVRQHTPWTRTYNALPLWLRRLFWALKDTP